MRYTVTKIKSSCPNCKRIIYRGPREIGPGAIECKKCGKVVKTELIEWDIHGKGEGVKKALIEFFAPSFFGFRETPTRVGRTAGLWIVSSCLAYLFFMSIVTYIFMIPYENQNSQIVPTILAFLTYPVFLVFRIIYMIRESKKYAENQIPPKW